MDQTFTRWRIWPIARGSYSQIDIAGHAKVLGCYYSWIIGPPWGSRELDLWRLFAIRVYADGDIDWAFGKLEIHWRRASWRYIETKQRAARRKAKRQIAAMKVGAS
jgi:hypothetical protein